MTKWLFCCLALSPATCHAQVNVVDDEHLIRACTTADMHWVDFCNGLVRGVHDLGAALGIGCSPAGTTRTKLVEHLTVQGAILLVGQPEMAGKNDAVVGPAILSDVSPCHE